MERQRSERELINSARVTRTGAERKKIYSIRGSQLRRVAEKPIRIRVPAMMDCRSYGKLSVKHNIDPCPLRPTPRSRRFASLPSEFVPGLRSATWVHLYTAIQTFSPPDTPPSPFFLFPTSARESVTISQMAHLRHHRSCGLHKKDRSRNLCSAASS